MWQPSNFFLNYTETQSLLNFEIYLIEFLKQMDSVIVAPLIDSILYSFSIYFKCYCSLI